MSTELGRKLLRLADRLGAEDVQIVAGGKHPRLVGMVRGRPFRYVFPFTPSDWRSERNVIAGVKRLLVEPKEAGEEETAKTNKPRKKRPQGSARRADLKLPQISRPERHDAPKRRDPDDRFLRPLQVLRERMRAELEEAAALEPSGEAPPRRTPQNEGEPTSARGSRCVLRTPWLGGRRRAFRA